MKLFSQATLGLCTALFALPVFTSATPAGSAMIAREQTCTTGAMKCCESTHSPGDHPLISTLSGLLGLILDLDSLIGADCSPITAVGLGGTSCTAQTVCCQGNNFGSGLLVLGCSSINIDL